MERGGGYEAGWVDVKRGRWIWSGVGGYGAGWIWSGMDSDTERGGYGAGLLIAKIYVGNLCEDLHAGLSVVVSWIRLSVGN